ncbi:DUF4047 domain-containing protein [Gottfriedia solisilvae]|uniref:DUF4047 domain-containing protein n=1 Tax=Gottfriedia solisilvae TaxID=1516104 RepID=A0A8J3ASG0_9BACI|nr:DUF4047 domain-containing protein [Gottfriedia solisilvae]GGI15791.1 hypothetical protein GCM10007380_29790 [Gottfriedia solisilvae]
MKVRIRKIILLPCLCCMAFYGGSQLVGNTEASFSSQASPDSITMSAAFVFPATIRQLEVGAQRIANSMEHDFKSINATSPEATIEELHKKLAEITAIKQDLTLQLGTLLDLYEEVSMYYKEIQNQEGINLHTFDYVSEGYKNVDGILNEVQAAIDFHQIDVIHSSILIQIQKLEEKEQTSMEQTQSNQQLENSEAQDNGSTNLDNDGEVTADEEKTMEHSK